MQFGALVDNGFDDVAQSLAARLKTIQGVGNVEGKYPSINMVNIQDKAVAEILAALDESMSQLRTRSG